ncbi:MAG: hypothetical protein WCK85_04840 [Chlorobium sp.]
MQKRVPTLDPNSSPIARRSLLLPEYQAWNIAITFTITTIMLPREECDDRAR